MILHPNVGPLHGLSEVTAPEVSALREPEPDWPPELATLLHVCRVVAQARIRADWEALMLRTPKARDHARLLRQSHLRVGRQLVEALR